MTDNAGVAEQRLDALDVERAIASMSNPAKALRKCSRLRRMVSQLDPPETLQG